MSNESIYTSIIEAKNGSLIPVLQNGKTIESRYNPVGDAERKISLISENANFIIVFSLGSGLVVSKLLEKNPDSKILVIEPSDKDFSFLEQLPLVSKLKTNNNIIFSDICSLYKNLVTQYIPSFYGNLELLENKNWELENQEYYLKAKQIIKIALEDIKKDFSVQAHFGKILQANILNNLKLLNQTPCVNYNPDTTKTALVIAAGPSLDHQIDYIKKNRDSFFIIATDTAFLSLNKNNIFCDCAVSLDGQTISCNHFLNTNNIKNTLFIFDLSASFSAAKNLVDKGCSVLFSKNSHPFSNYANDFCNNSLISLESGAGTVTIGALDFAIKTGFKKIKILGADFSYPNNKAYTKSTYLDDLYSLKSNRIISTEKQFSALMFRTPLIESDNIKTTEVLLSYKNSLLNFLKERQIEYSYTDFIYTLENPLSASINKSINQTCNYSLLIESFSKQPEIKQIQSIFDLKKTDICLLPLISWLRNNDDIKEGSFSYYLEKAYTTTQRYF